MNFCSQCGKPVTQRIPEGDARLRLCDHCSDHSLPEPQYRRRLRADLGRQVLLCRRAIEPRMGYWTLPAGFMENGETLEQAAMRETPKKPAPACAT
jgi:NADH pyrophosphatase NudC (nudix superfamily)